MPRDNGGPAFPRTGFHPRTDVVHPEDLRAALDTRTEPEAGMTLRDWFAGQCLEAIVSRTLYRMQEDDSWADAAAWAAKIAYMHADALLAARAK